LGVFKLILKGLPKTLLWRLPLLLLIVPAVFILHTFLLVYVNEGFNGGTGWFLDHSLCIQGKNISGMMFWFLISALIPAIIKGMWKTGGPFKYISESWKKLLEAFRSFKTANPPQMPFILGGMAALCLLSWLWSNALVSAMILMFALRGMVAMAPGSFPYILANAARNDIHRVFAKRPPEPLTPKDAFYIYAGVVLALVATAIPGLEGYGPIIGALCVVLILVNKEKYRPSATAATLLFLAVAAAAAFLGADLMADDGGWQESGGTFDRWIQSSGAVTAIAMGVPPAMASAMGVLAGGLVDAVAAAVPDIPAAAAAPVPTEAIEEDPNKGWVYSERYGRLVPTEGAVDDQGRVYRKVPWDDSGYAFVTPEEAERLDEMNSAGKIWAHNQYMDPDAAREMDEDWKEWSSKPSPTLKKLVEAEKRSKQIEAEIQNTGRRIEAIQMEDVIRKIQNNEHMTYDDMERMRNASDYLKKHIKITPVTMHSYKKAWIEDHISQKNIDRIATGLGCAKFACDTTVSVLGACTGPPGKAIATIYTAATNYLGAKSKAAAEWDRNLSRDKYDSYQEASDAETTKGVKNAIYSIALDEAMGPLFGKIGGKMTEKLLVKCPYIHKALERSLRKTLMRKARGIVRDGHRAKVAFRWLTSKSTEAATNLLENSFSEMAKNSVKAVHLDKAWDSILKPASDARVDKIMEKLGEQR